MSAVGGDAFRSFAVRVYPDALTSEFVVVVFVVLLGALAAIDAGMCSDRLERSSCAPLGDTRLADVEATAHLCSVRSRMDRERSTSGADAGVAGTKRLSVAWFAGSRPGLHSVAGKAARVALVAISSFQPRRRSRASERADDSNHMAGHAPVEVRGGSYLLLGQNRTCCCCNEWRWWDTGGRLFFREMS